MWFQILNFDVEGLKKEKKIKNWWAPKNTGGKDRLQDRLSSSKINSQTQIKILCHLLCFLSGTETVFYNNLLTKQKSPCDATDPEFKLRRS